MAGFIFADTATIDGAQQRALLGAMLSKPAERPMGAFTGLPAGAGTVVTATSTGLEWTVIPHVGNIDAETPAAAGAYAYGFDAPITGNYNAADMAHDRLDLLSVQIDDPAEGDGTGAEMPAVVYTPGTAAASPSLPAGPDRSMNLAQIRVPAGGGAPVVTMIAPFTVASGGIMPTPGSAGYPANPYKGQYIDDAVLGLQRYDGTRWTRGASAGDSVVALRTSGNTFGGVGSTTYPVIAYDQRIDVIGTAITFSAGIATVHVDGHYRWSATVLWDVGTGTVEAFPIIDGADSDYGRHQHELIAGYRASSNPGDKLILSAGDTVQLGVKAVDGTTRNNIQVRLFSLELICKT